MDLNKAKELFISYGTNKFQMSREGVYDEYRSYGITKEQENEWLTELLEEEIAEFDINDYHSFYLLLYVIQTNCNKEYLQKVLDHINANLKSCSHQYYILTLGQLLFNLLLSCSKRENAISKAIKLQCIHTIESLADKARNISVPAGFEIPDFSVVSNGLPRDQYILRKIVELEHEIQIASILK